jgi:hypothetical protein
VRDQHRLRSVMTYYNGPKNGQPTNLRPHVRFSSTGHFSGQVPGLPNQAVEFVSVAPPVARAREGQAPPRHAGSDASLTVLLSPAIVWTDSYRELRSAWTPFDRPPGEPFCCQRATVSGRRHHASRHARDESSKSSFLTTSCEQPNARATRAAAGAAQCYALRDCSCRTERVWESDRGRFPPARRVRVDDIQERD